MKIQQLENCTRMFVAIVKTLDDESTRFIGTFKHEKKKVYTNLLNDIKVFNGTVKANMKEDNIIECEKIQDYLHSLVYDLINKEGKKDIDLFCAMCKSLRTIYYKYIHGTFKHTDKDKFMSVINTANLFANLNESNNLVNEEFEYFCVTLIEGRSYERAI